MVAKVLVNMGVMVRAQVMMYKALAQKVLLYGSESWVLMEVMLKLMEGFHHWLDRRISGMSGWRIREEGWE